MSDHVGDGLREHQPDDERNSTGSLPTPEEVKSLISQATLAMSSIEDAEPLVREMLKVEKPMIKWLTSLVKKELEDDYKPTEDELTWIRRIAKFYHAFVPLMKFVLEVDGKQPVNVLVSHTGPDKLSYAAPLKYYLEMNGVDGVFIDKDMRIGSDADDERMWAAVSCKYFWCVLSKDFVQNWYPMRELMVGYIRHIQEGNDFSLILDCLEMGAGPTGSWMDRIFKLEALRLYTANGDPVNHPANMQVALPLEGLNVRYERIAALRMADGSVIVRRDIG